ncbi:MAG: hypothetical protein Q8K92_07115 [Leadbetterella sp.]|nr:hypothetical protein [Leadbetterella sp.]
MSTDKTSNTYPKGGVSCSNDSYVVIQTLVFQIIPIAIKSCKSPALRVAAKLRVLLNNQTFKTIVIRL